MIGNQARVSVATGARLDVRSFTVVQQLGRPFRAELSATSEDLALDFDAILGADAELVLHTAGQVRRLTGVCTSLDQTRVDDRGLATYVLAIEPRLHLTSLRRNYRIYQYLSELDVARRLLDEWGVAHRVLADPSAHVARKFRVQYDESDLDFLCRMLEDAGITAYFEDSDEGSVLVLDDAPQEREPEPLALRFHDRPGPGAARFATALRVVQRVRPGASTIGDLDYRRASTNQPRLSAAWGLPPEQRLEHFDYEPGAFLYQSDTTGASPTADDRGAARTDERIGARKVQARLLSRRQDARRVSLESDALDLWPGKTFRVDGHPHPVVDPQVALLVTSATLEGDHDGDWRAFIEACRVDVPYVPPRITPRPCVRGLESATVVGPASEEIHTDEYARVRVHFHWDRESARDERSSCWIPTSQPWSGAGFGGTVLPRIGQEVLVEFLGGDPDRPVVVGRVFTEHQPPPYPLPEGKTITGLVGKSTPALVLGSSEGFNLGQIIPAQVSTRPRDQAFAARQPQGFPMSNRENAFLLGDQAGQNITFLQAQRDLNFVVRHGWRSVVGNFRGTLIGGEDHLHVRNKQFINVMVDQELSVEQNQSITVGNAREEYVQQELGLVVRRDALVRVAGPIDQDAAESIVVEAGERIRIRVGNSMIVMDDKSVIVQSTKVDINPS